MIEVAIYLQQIHKKDSVYHIDCVAYHIGKLAITG